MRIIYVTIMQQILIICIFLVWMLFSFFFKQLILDRISKGINDKVNGQAPLQKAIFKFAYDYKKIWTQRGYETPLLDK